MSECRYLGACRLGSASADGACRFDCEGYEPMPDSAALLELSVELEHLATRGTCLLGRRCAGCPAEGAGAEECHALCLRDAAARVRKALGGNDE